MLTKCARRIIDLLWENEDEVQKEICVYGCELCLYTVLSTAGLLVIGALLGDAAEAAIMIAVFFLCQSTGGGYHADSHLKCFVTMALGLLLGILFIHAKIPLFLCALLIAASATVLLSVPLKLHANKQYMQSSSEQLRFRSRMVTVFILLCAVILWCMGLFAPLTSICASLIASAVSRLKGNGNPPEKTDKSVC